MEKMVKERHLKDVTSELSLTDMGRCNPLGNSNSKAPVLERRVGCLRTE